MAIGTVLPAVVALAAPAQRVRREDGTASRSLRQYHITVQYRGFTRILICEPLTLYERMQCHLNTTPHQDDELCPMHLMYGALP